MQKSVCLLLYTQNPLGSNRPISLSIDLYYSCANPYYVSYPESQLNIRKCQFIFAFDSGHVHRRKTCFKNQKNV